MTHKRANESTALYEREIVAWKVRRLTDYNYLAIVADKRASTVRIASELSIIEY